MKLTRPEMASLCKEFGLALNVGPGIDGQRLLWAIAGRETSFGSNIVPRHEQGYCYGSAAYKRDEKLRTMSAEWGCAAHSSYGPWQILFYNARLQDPASDVVAMLTNPRICARVTVERLNHIIEVQNLTTVKSIADAWNSGSGHDANVPTDYIAEVVKFYDTEPWP